MVIEEQVVQTVKYADNDRAWKEILRIYLQDFVAFFWQEAYDEIDWTRSYELLEQELMAVGVQEEIGRKSVDKLFKVFLKNGQEQWLLLHLEIQHKSDEQFPERMFTYFYRIFDRYRRDVASMAVLADNDVQWRPKEYLSRIWGSEIYRKYDLVKITDYRTRKEELLKSNNPFALVVLAQLLAIETKPHHKKRLTTKLEFIQYLRSYGWDNEKIRNMYQFLDVLLNLNEEFEIQYLYEVKQLEKEYQMNLITTAERHALKQGIQQGVQQGEAQLLLMLLKKRFGDIPEAYITKIQNAKIDFLSQWALNFVTAQSLEEIFQ